MPRSSPPTWWAWVQRNLDARGWTPAELAREIRAQYGYGPDESVIGRWKNRKATPSLESIRVVAQVFNRDIREALIAAGLFTEAELNAQWVVPWRADLATVPDELLINELRARMDKPSRHGHARARGIAPANGPDRTTVAPSRPGGVRHAITPGPKAEPAPSSPNEDEEAGAANDAQHEMC